jgi:hypothetical protein
VYPLDFTPGDRQPGRRVHRPGLLGYPAVKNYDGSWTEWGNLVGVEIERP